MAKLHGKDGKLYVNGVLYVSGVSWQITVNRDYADISVYGDQWKVVAAGLPGIDGTFAGFWDSGGDAIVNGFNTLNMVPIALYASDSEQVASGNAFVTVTIDASVADAVRCSGTFKGSGSWTIS